MTTTVTKASRIEKVAGGWVRAQPTETEVEGAS
jgi:hypothetical protein